MAARSRQSDDHAPKTATEHGAPQGPTPLPDDFWTHEDIQRASRLNHFGYLLKAYRELQHPPVKQTQLAAWLGMTQGQISRIERGVSTGHTLAKLVEWATILNIPQSILWFELGESKQNPYTEPKATHTIESQDDSEGDDVDRRQLFKTASIGAVLLGTEISSLKDDYVADSTRAVGESEIESLRYWTAVYRHADNRFGGGDSFENAGYFLQRRVVPMLRDSRSTSKVKRELDSAAAELYQLTGWISYDTGDKETGRKCLRQAFQLCEDAGNHQLGAEMLAAMSHQAAFLRAPAEASALAVAARQKAAQAGEPALMAEAAVMEAHALALDGDARGCINALRAAEDHFARIRSDNLPTWLSYFDRAYLSAKFGHALRDLGRPADAERFARQSLQMTEGYERGRTFNMALLAGVLADKGDLNESVTVARQAVRMARNVRSSRTVTYLSDVGHRLQRFEKDSRVRSLCKDMAARGIPTVRVA